MPACLTACLTASLTASHHARGLPRGIAALALAAALWAAAPLAAGAQQIVDRAAVEAAIARGALVWDTRSAKDYAAGHLPGAVNVGDVGVALRNQNTEDYLPIEQLQRVLGAAGIDPASREIVVYGARGNPYVYFAHQTLRYFGATRSVVYHDGIDGWRETGGAISAEPARPAPVALTLEPRPQTMVDTREMIARAGDPDVQLIDARTAPEFAGDDIRALRGGRIPGAVNIPFEANWVDPQAAGRLARREVPDNAGMRLKPAESLHKLYEGLDRERETIVYCQSGIRASETATVLADLGFRNVRIYDSSWLGYGNTLEAPAEGVKFVNVGALQAQLQALRARLDQLEQRLPKP